MSRSGMAKVRTEDLWDAIDALDALPEIHKAERYKRLDKAAEEGYSVVLVEEEAVTKH